jgi:hypothetical protein
MIDPSAHLLLDGAQGDIKHVNIAGASQPAMRSPTPGTDASQSRLPSLTSPPKYIESHPAVPLSPHHLRPLLMASVRNESDSHGRTIQERRLHSGTKNSKRHACNECSKSYSHAKNLREQKSKHRNERYSCSICGGSVAEKINLPRHKELKHGILRRLQRPWSRPTTIDPAKES